MKLKSYSPLGAAPCSESSFCYEVRDAGIPSCQVAGMIAEDWHKRGGVGPIRILLLGGGHWVARHLESWGVSILGVEVNSRDVHVRVGTELAYHVVDVANNPKEGDARPVGETVTDGDRSDGGAGAEANQRGVIREVLANLVRSIKAADFKAVMCRLVHRSENSSPNAQAMASADNQTPPKETTL